MGSETSALRNIVLGILGSFVGGILFGLVGLSATGLVGEIIVSVTVSYTHLDVYKRQAVDRAGHQALEVGDVVELFDQIAPLHGLVPVSYTHLDVYKRQAALPYPESGQHPRYGSRGGSFRIGQSARPAVSA